MSRQMGNTQMRATGGSKQSPVARIFWLTVSIAHRLQQGPHSIFGLIQQGRATPAASRLMIKPAHRLA